MFISGSGRLLKNFIDNENSQSYQICLVGSDRNCLGLHHAMDAILPYVVSNNCQRLLDIASSNGADFVCLAGYLSLIEIPKKWENKITE